MKLKSMSLAMVLMLAVVLSQTLAQTRPSAYDRTQAALASDAPEDLPDLTIVKVQFISKLETKVLVKNIGQKRSPVSSLTFSWVLNAEKGEAVHYGRVHPALEPGQEVWVNFQVVPQELPTVAGKDVWIACDYNDDIKEANELNNRLKGKWPK
ncbi:MAG TPA: CARDB domain-containing protein [Pyrinomonadaceae bacterium]